MVWMLSIDKRLGASGLVSVLIAAVGLIMAITAMPAMSQQQLATEKARTAKPGDGESDASTDEDRSDRSRQGRAAAASCADASRQLRDRLPRMSVTRHKIELPGRTLSFIATAEAIPLIAASGEVTGEIAVIAYTLEGRDPTRRPVTFAMNGGPGSASAWVHLGMMGPWRLEMAGDAARPSAPTDLKPNADTWLDFTDLVFIDPVGTGFSRTVGNDEARAKAAKFYYSVDGDIESISAAIRIWLTKYRRSGSPKFFAGESYAGFRAPKVARKLQTEHGVGLAGIMMISPVIDFKIGRGGRRDPLSWVVSLPSQAAAAADRRGPVSPSDLELFETYARGDFLADIMKGERDEAAVARIVTRVSGLTGLDQALVKRLKGRIDALTFRRELDRSSGLIGSAYDATVGGIDPYPAAASFRMMDDPFTSALTAPVTSAMVVLYSSVLTWLPSRRYNLSGNLISRWDWGDKRLGASAADELEAALALDPKFKVHVSHGYADLVTPYFASKLIIEQIAAAPSAARVTLSVYAGGHMFYSREASRKAYREEIATMVKSTLNFVD